MQSAVLWHGTGEKSVSSIVSQGLITKSRLYVHLSKDTKTAKKVGSRHGRPVIYRVYCKKMSEDGHRLFLSASGVWLTKTVPPEYLQKDHHTLCPILSVSSYLFREPHSSAWGIPVVITFVYGIIMLAMNWKGCFDGPYPFFRVKNQSGIATVLWMAALTAMITKISLAILWFAK